MASPGDAADPPDCRPGRRRTPSSRDAAASRDGGGTPTTPVPPEAAPKQSRSERRAAAIRADLEPLAPGEYPAPLRISIALAALLGLINLVGYAAGLRVNGRHLGPGILSFSLVMGIAVWGLWRRRYWAVLGFEALVVIVVLYFSLLLVVASNLAGLGVCLLVIGLGSWLFWKLVRVMARLQVPAEGASTEAASR